MPAVWSPAIPSFPDHPGVRPVFVGAGRSPGPGSLVVKMPVTVPAAGLGGDFAGLDETLPARGGISAVGFPVVISPCVACASGATGAILCPPPDTVLPGGFGGAAARVSVRTFRKYLTGILSFVPNSEYPLRVPLSIKFFSKYALSIFNSYL